MASRTMHKTCFTRPTLALDGAAAATGPSIQTRTIIGVAPTGCGKSGAYMVLSSLGEI
jgi:hypothetical protein